MEVKAGHFRWGLVATRIPLLCIRCNWFIWDASKNYSQIPVWSFWQPLWVTSSDVILISRMAKLVIVSGPFVISYISKCSVSFFHLQSCWNLTLNSLFRQEGRCKEQWTGEGLVVQHMLVGCNSPPHLLKQSIKIFEITCLRGGNGSLKLCKDWICIYRNVKMD